MVEYKTAVEKICKYSFVFANIDTLFIDSSSNTQIEYGHTDVPQLLSPYWRNVGELLNLQDYNYGEDAVIHITPYLTKFISVRVCNGGEYLGNIVVGPYLSEEPNILMIEKIIFENKLSISLKNIIKQYYCSLPLVSSYKSKLIAESLTYSVMNIQYMGTLSTNIVEKKYKPQTEFLLSPDSVIKNTKESAALIEERYKNENTMLHAVEMGDIEKVEETIKISRNLFNGSLYRIPNDPLRSLKNSAFVLNTLLRKASEKGGLHPIDIHSISEKYAIQIEKITTIKQLTDLKTKMRLEYCSAVKKLSLKNYSYLAKKAIEFIRNNLDGDLSLEAISNSIDVSMYELSRKFKKETGYNITEYINIQRINEAMYIMQNQSISITDIAYMVGFNDITYFTKVFKKVKGVTPSVYRKNKS
ncbi:helix-turn-helix domain-containing protein [Clostridium intestinale]|uniref:helix-turn-helix domain-containing protein n=1 Tax=Clostridium intestinale TaxID=36845 RepID=UPI0028E887A3|nr:helix-turn-helix domain-containing protein [Clostridium intestinale]